MVSEKIIDRIIGQFEAEEVDYEKTTHEFAERQPAILSFLMSDHEGALNNDERDFMIYLAIVIWRSVEHVNSECKIVRPKKISSAEEANWAVIEKIKRRNFRDRLDVFFEDTLQEDLLAFIEDSLTLDEIDDGADGIQVTKEGIEPMFVMLKTVVDVLTSQEDW